jgi:hypothetical protein
LAHSRKVSAKVRKAVLARMTDEQKAELDSAMRAIQNDWLVRRGLKPVEAV